MEHIDDPLLRDRVLTVMTGLHHLGAVTLRDLADGLAYDTDDLHQLMEFMRLVDTGQRLDWWQVHGTVVMLTNKGKDLARQFVEFLADRGMDVQAVMNGTAVVEGDALDREWERYNGYDPRDPAPEWPEDWPS